MKSTSSIRFSTVAWWSWPLIVIDTLALMALRSSFFRGRAAGALPGALDHRGNITRDEAAAISLRGAHVGAHFDFAGGHLTRPRADGVVQDDAGQKRRRLPRIRRP